MDNSVRVGPKKPNMSINTSIKTGKAGPSENCSAHVATGNKTVTGGQGVYGMPLMSAASAKAK
jgi:hypothetical protein